MYKKAWCTCEIVVLLIKPIAFVEFPSPSSDLKVPIGIGQLGTRFSGRCHCREVYTRVNIWIVRRGKKVAVVERWPSVEVRQPKYCYEKTIHVVLNQLCSSLWTSLFRQYMHVCVWVCVCVCVWYLTEIIIDKSPKYGCYFSLAPVVIWGTVAPLYFCMLLGTKKIVVVVPWSESSCDSTSE